MISAPGHRAALATLCAWLLALVAALGGPRAAAVQLTQFDHLTTSYELRGIHRDLSCEYCHVNDVFKGTPRSCSGCHTLGTRINATPRPVRHIAVRDQCESCHTQFNFLPLVRMDHSLVIGSCFSCHNGVVAQGKKPGHIPSNNDCDACHTTNAFNPQRVEHAALLAAATSCRGCHSGVRAQAVPRNHLATAQQCGDCHSTLTWSPARLEHAGLTTPCRGCHNGQTATGLPIAHMASSHDCASCHRYPRWSAAGYVHSAASYPGEHRGSMPCSACHSALGEQVSWKSPALQSSCAGCHASLFRSQSHPKTVAGLTYSLNELSNCTAACHIYSDARMTAVVRMRPAGHHKVSDSAFH